MRGIALAAAVMMLAGCVTFRPAAEIIDRADRLVQQGDYAGAVQAYDELIAKYPDDDAAPRARAMRELLGARTEAARLRDTLAARETELGRLRQEVQRLSTEAERLRTDLEQLKQIDLRQDRRKR